MHLALFQNSPSNSFIPRLDSGIMSSLDLYQENRYFLVDANVNVKLLRGEENKIYTTREVVVENSYWGTRLPDTHIICSYTRSDFKKTGGMVQLTGSDVYGEAFSTVFYENQDSSTACGNCDAPTSMILTDEDGTTTYACQALSGTDFGLLVSALAFPKFVLLTDEGCLGWSSASLGSLTWDLDRWMKWDDKFLKNVSRTP